MIFQAVGNPDMAQVLLTLCPSQVGFPFKSDPEQSPFSHEKTTYELFLPLFLQLAMGRVTLKGPIFLMECLTIIWILQVMSICV